MTCIKFMHFTLHNQETSNDSELYRTECGRLSAQYKNSMWLAWITIPKEWGPPLNFSGQGTSSNDALMMAVYEMLSAVTAMTSFMDMPTEGEDFFSKFGKNFKIFES